VKSCLLVCSHDRMLMRYMRQMVGRRMYTLATAMTSAIGSGHRLRMHHHVLHVSLHDASVRGPLLMDNMTSPIPSRQGSLTSPPPASPRRPSGLSAGQSVEQRRARREQFRSFYGLKGEGQSNNGESSKSGDPLDLGECPQIRYRETRKARRRIR
jgi:hypothetical protein